MANLVDHQAPTQLSAIDWIGACAMAAAGGALPTLARLASTYVADPLAPMPGRGLYVGVTIFAFLGIILCVAFRQVELRQALVIGIAAPGVITNIVAGLDSTKKTTWDLLSYSTAVASERTLDGLRLLNVSAHVRRVLILPVVIDSEIEIDPATVISVRQKPDGAVGALRPKGSVIELEPGTRSLEFSAESLTPKSTNLPPLGDLIIMLRIDSRPNFASELKWALGGTRRAVAGGIHVEVISLTGSMTDATLARIQRLTASDSSNSKARFGLSPEVAGMIVELLRGP